MSEPKRLVRPLPAGWVFTKRSWFLFFLREITCIFVGLFALLLIFQVRAVAAGPESYAKFVRWLEQPWVIAFHVIAFLFLLLHTVTWFVAAPKALRMRIGNYRVPPNAIVAGHYAAWMAVSAFLFWLLVG